MAKPGPSVLPYASIGVAVHPGYATSFEYRSPQGAPGLYGHYLGKRETAAEPQGVAFHPGHATSFENRSPEGAPGLYGYGYPTLSNGHFLGKRKAEPQGIALHPGYATFFEHRSTQGAPALLP